MNKWTSDEIQKVKELATEGLLLQEIADKMGRSRGSIKTKLNRDLGIKISDFYDNIYREKIECLTCKKEFSKLKSEERKYCSRSCAAKTNNIGIKRNIEIRKCFKCEKDFQTLKTSNKIYCSSKCCSNKLNSLRSRRPVNDCFKCGKKTGNSKYCSNKCQKELEKENKYKLIESGLVSSNKMLRKYMFEKDEHICKICGTTEWMGKEVPLVLDHINGDPYNNKPENLRLICCNCDAQTDTYKGKNVGKGRHKRMERYYEGKSF